jgi:cytochrome c oxidase subunit 2
VLFAIVLLLITFGTIYFFTLDRKWWFPPSITAIGQEVDRQFMRTLWITGVVFFLSQVTLAWVIFRYRAKNATDKARYSHGSNTMEVVWTTATIIFFVGLGFYGKDAWAEMYWRTSDPGALQVDVLAQQFAWNFRYAGPDGHWGKTDVKLIDDSSNPVGLDPADPAGKDDIVTAVITVPVNREIELLLRTKDVTHSFFVRELRFKQDTVPGMVIRLHFKAEKTGRFEIACAELCGLGHHRMRSFLNVVTQEEYDKWMAEEVKLKLEESQ